MHVVLHLVSRDGAFLSCLWILLLHSVGFQIHFGWLELWLFRGHALRAIVPLNQEDDIFVVVERLQPKVIDTSHKIPRLVSNLATQGDNAALTLLPHFILRIV